MSPSPLASLPENLIRLFTSANRYGVSEYGEMSVEVLLACDTAGLIDWRAPRASGHTFLVDFSLSAPSDLTCRLLPLLVERHGVDLLTQAEGDGTPSYQAVWSAHVKDAAKVAAFTYSSEGKSQATESVVRTWLDHLPAECLSWLDSPGDQPGAGWVASALKIKSNFVVETLATRGVALSSSSAGSPLILDIHTIEQWHGFLESGGNPDETGWSQEFPDLPLWEVLVRERGLKAPDVMDKVVAWAKDNGKPGAEEALYWHKMRVLREENLEEHLKSRSDWRTVRDWWGRPALWVAAMHLPRLWRLAAEGRDREGILSARDAFGHDAWFYAMGHLSNKTMTEKLWGLMRARIRVSERTLSEGWAAQWLEDEAKTTQLLEGRCWWNHTSRYGNAAPDIRLSGWSSRVWSTESSVQDALAVSLLSSRSLSSSRLAMLASGMYQASKCGWSEDDFEAWTPRLRMAVGFTALVSAIHETNSDGANALAPVEKFLDFLERQGWEWPPELPPEQASKRLLEAVRVKRNKSYHAHGMPAISVDHPLIEAWQARLDAIAVGQAIAPAPIAGQARRARM